MKKYQQALFLLFVVLVCTLCAVLPMFSFEENQKILFGLTLEELQGYVYFISSGIIAVLIIQYTYRLYTSEKRDNINYEDYSNIMLNDGQIHEHFEKK